MAQAQEPNDKNHELERLEDTQVTARELTRGFDRVYEEIEHLEDKVDRLQSDFEGVRDEINQKFRYDFTTSGRR
jgi:chaperonin cofactor prefoldin